MPLYNIRAVKNGYVVQLTEYGDDYIAATLKDVAVLAGEYFAENNPVHYRSETGNQLPEIIRLARGGAKIEAIKMMRSQYSSTLGLREAKDLVDAFYEAYRSQIPEFSYEKS